MKLLVGALVALALLPASGQAPATRENGLRIRVIAGEDAVNIIQQKTAVAPIVEVRDRNNLPVPGAVVTFAVEGGKAASFAGGASTLTVTTNAAGQAAAAGFSPLASGAVQINVQAAFQGQVIGATIAQTNVLTAAEAAAAAGASGGSAAGGGATGAAGGGGGGLSATTIGVIGAAVGGGALVASQVGGSEPEPAAQDQGIYEGAFAIEMTWRFSDGRGGFCTRVERYSGTLGMELTLTNGVVSGPAQVNGGRAAVLSGNCQGGPQAGQTNTWGMPSAPVTGSPSGMSFTQQLVGQGQDTPTSPVTMVTTNWKFSGAQRGTDIVGDYAMEIRQDPPGFPTNSASGVTSVTLNHIR
jgi:hypothetical protein